MDAKFENDTEDGAEAPILKYIKENLDDFFATVVDINSPPLEALVQNKAQQYLISNLNAITNQDEKYAALLTIDERFQKEKSKGDESINKLIRQLKDKIINKLSQEGYPKPYRNWKDALLRIDPRYQPISRTFLEQKRVYPDMQQPITFSNAARFKTSTKKNVCAISGSSFATDNQNRLTESLDKSGYPKEAAVLDGSYTASTSDGWVMAVADGCGHREAENENEDIGRTSYFAAKNACRLMAGYDDADSLSNSLSELKKRISQELPVKVRAHRNQPLKPNRGQDLEKTTLACARAFRTKDGFRLVGFNVGDTMLIAYDPTKKTFQTIAKARQILRDPKNSSPAALPDLCKNHEMVIFDDTLPEGAIVFGLTDGVWDYLPVKQNPKTEQQQTGRIDTEIDFQKLMADPNFKLPENVTVTRLTKAIADYSIQKTEQERLNRLALQMQQSQQMIENNSLQKLPHGPAVKDSLAVKDKCDHLVDQLVDAFKAQTVSVGHDYTLVGMVLSTNLDPTPDYTAGEVAASILTLGLYALIKDCLHIGTDNEITIGDGVGAAAAIFGFFATGSLLGVGYLAYKGIRTLDEKPPERGEEQPESPKKTS